MFSFPYLFIMQLSSTSSSFDIQYFLSSSIQSHQLLTTLLWLFNIYIFIPNCLLYNKVVSEMISYLIILYKYFLRWKNDFHRSLTLNPNQFPYLYKLLIITEIQTIFQYLNVNIHLYNYDASIFTVKDSDAIFLPSYFIDNLKKNSQLNISSNLLYFNIITYNIVLSLALPIQSLFQDSFDDKQELKKNTSKKRSLHTKERVDSIYTNPYLSEWSSIPIDVLESHIQFFINDKPIFKFLYDQYIPLLIDHHLTSILDISTIHIYDYIDRDSVIVKLNENKLNSYIDDCIRSIIQEHIHRYFDSGYQYLYNNVLLLLNGINQNDSIFNRVSLWIDISSIQFNECLKIYDYKIKKLLYPYIIESLSTLLHRKVYRSFEWVRRIDGRGNLVSV